jgi:hypothetical protein
VSTLVVTPRKSVRRVAFGVVAALLLAVAVLEAVNHGTGYWQLAAFGFGPDIALLLGVGKGVEKGRLHPRAVRLYNLVHRFWGPLLLVALGAAGVIPLGYLVGGLAWAFHVALDRSVGYGLRTRDGYQRP